MVGLEMTYTDEEFNKIYNTVVDELRGNLTPEEYKELITLDFPALERPKKAMCGKLSSKP